MGNMIRSCVLPVMALLTLWRAGAAAGSAMLFSAVNLGIIDVWVNTMNMVR